MTYDTINDAMTMAGGEGTLLANRYRIVRQLGQGGMGSVWLVEDTQLDNKPFAIKMLPSILVSNKRAYRQLKDEALVAMQLVHPNIVQIRAFEENDGNPFLVMDYVDGQTLDDYLCEECKIESVKCKVGGGICEDDVIRILKPIAAALDYAHAKGVVHRDVKPGNVMIAKDGTPYILDFGIAREIQETVTRVTGKLSSGTLLYMSPEQLMGECPKPAQDVYSFAAMVYECLKGEPPFVRGSIEDQIKNKQPAPLVGRGVLDAPLAALVMAGLAKKPEDRPATCAAVLEGKVFGRAEHVERVDFVRRGTFDTSQSGRARSPSAPPGPQPGRAVAPRPPQGGSCSRATAAILAVAALALVVAGGWWWASRKTSDMSQNDARKQSEADTEKYADRDLLRDGLKDSYRVKATETVSDAEQRVSSSGRVLINLNADGKVSMDGQDLTFEEVTSHLACIVANSPGLEVVIQVDTLCSYEKLASLIDACRKSNVRNISFVTEPDAKDSGSVAQPQQVLATVHAETTGHVKEICFKSGDLVEKGQVLFKLDDKPLLVAVALRKAELKLAEAECRRAERCWKRIKAADARGITQKEYDDAEADAEKSRAAILRSQANLRRAELELKKANIVAPVSGRIRLAACIGEAVSPDSPFLAEILSSDSRVDAGDGTIQEVDIFPRTKGRVAKIFAIEGAFVKRGDLLCQLDDEQATLIVDQRKADVEVAEAECCRAERYWERMKAADARGITQKERDEAEAGAEKARAEVYVARARLIRAEYEYAHTKVYAPASGRMTRINVQLGDYVTPDKTVIVKMSRCTDFGTPRQTLYTSDVLTDASFGISVNAVKLIRRVEVCQWKENQHISERLKTNGAIVRVTTYTYSKVWSEDLISSDWFKEAGHDNPKSNRYKSEEFLAKNVTKVETGARLSTDQIRKAADIIPYILPSHYACPLPGAQIMDNKIYVRNGGNAGYNSTSQNVFDQPRIGDMRVSFFIVKAKQQDESVLQPEKNDAKRAEKSAKAVRVSAERNMCEHAGRRGYVLWKGGPYWAETNIGADKPWECGYYFWWGDTVGYKRENDAWVASDGSSSNFPFVERNVPTFGKDISALKRDGWITTENVLAPQHDAAQVQWGGGWRMPTAQELDDLTRKCDWSWTTMNGVNGYVIRGRGDYASASIFLPAAPATATGLRSSLPVRSATPGRSFRTRTATATTRGHSSSIRATIPRAAAAATTGSSFAPSTGSPNSERSERTLESYRIG